KLIKAARAGLEATESIRYGAFSVKKYQRYLEKRRKSCTCQKKALILQTDNRQTEYEQIFK
ncbi:MAG: hypothetical protein MJZ89_06685, partial [Paludibacteraceae bacterium]|nr:hypothetical protein [Paludibacteraceae bacterium]